MACRLISLLLMVSCRQVYGGHTAEDEERLIGWKGEVPSVSLKAKDPKQDSWIEQLSWEPRAYLWHNMLTKKQCDRIIKIATPRLLKSKVVDSKTGAEADDPIRTSFGASVTFKDDKSLMAEIDEKISQLSMLPPENSEQLQILRYTSGQKYDAHWDQFDNPVIHKEFFANGGQRVATALFYLSDVEEGGETVFPKSTAWLHKPVVQNTHSLRIDPTGFSACGSQGIAVRPKAGDVLFFWGVKLDGKTIDPSSMHAGCPVIRGTKWTATKWIHALEYNSGILKPKLKPGECKDLNDQCKLWAEMGECANNADFMVGTEDSEAQCGSSCESCSRPPPVKPRQSSTVQMDLSKITWRRRAR